MPKALREIYNTEAGKFFFDSMKAAYIDTSCLYDDNTNKTHYLLGIKECFQGLFLQMEIKEDTQPTELNYND